MDEQVVAVIRMEDASVSHDSLLAANGHRGISHPPPHSPFTRPLVLAGVASYHQADQPAATCGLAPRPESAKGARDLTRLRARDWRGRPSRDQPGRPGRAAQERWSGRCSSFRTYGGSPAG